MRSHVQVRRARNTDKWSTTCREKARFANVTWNSWRNRYVEKRTRAAFAFVRCTGSVIASYDRMTNIIRGISGGAHRRADCLTWLSLERSHDGMTAKISFGKAAATNLFHSGSFFIFIRDRIGDQRKQKELLHRMSSFTASRYVWLYMYILYIYIMRRLSGKVSRTGRCEYKSSVYISDEQIDRRPNNQRLALRDYRAWKMR
jgi:hypothetical protein